MLYPKGIKVANQTNKDNIKYDNRGMGLENDINITNEHYAHCGTGFIYKKPTPIQITKVDYTNRSAVIKEAFFKEPSTTDYNGLYKGKYIDFEAKETNSVTSFPLSNIHKHQINHIKNIINNDGIAFIIVRFTRLLETYLLLGNDFINFIENNDRKSIPVSYFKELGYLIKDKYSPRCDYLSIIDNIYGGINSEK